MKNNYFEQIILYMDKLKSLSRVKFKRFFLLCLILLCCDLLANEIQIKKMDVTVKDVVSETEEGYIETDKGYFLLPDVTNEVDMYREMLIENLEKAIDYEATIFLYGKIVVGILSENQNINIKPDFTIRQKKIYSSPPVEVKTTMEKWYPNTYQLSIVTVNGTFCISNKFEYSDYYEKVYIKLKGHSEMFAKINKPIILKYHKIKGGHECLGHVEDIEFIIDEHPEEPCQQSQQ